MVSISLSLLAKEEIKKSSEIRVINGKEYYMHLIAKGHTMYSLGRVYKISIAEIISENPSAGKGLKIGQLLKIPTNSSNESLSNTLRNNGNGEINPSLIAPKAKVQYRKDPVFDEKFSPEQAQSQNLGRKVVQIVEQELPALQANEHLVKAGETLYRLSIKYRVSVQKIKEANSVIDNRIYVGDRLKIPVTKKESEINEQRVERRRKISRRIETDKIEVKLIDKQVKELMPGSSFNIVLMLVNGSEKAKEFRLKITVPQSWSLLTDYSSVRVAKKSQQIKVLSFYIQKTTKVGNDEIIVEAFNATDNEDLGKQKIQVRVKPIYEIEVKTLETPDYVFSGDSLKVHFRIRNLSNIKATIDALTINGKLIENKTYTIEVDSFINVTIPTSTSKDIVYFTRKGVSLTATVVEQPEISITNSYAFDVIPSNKVKFDAYNRFPIRVTGLLVSDNSSGVKENGYMLDVRAKGLISSQKNRALEFHLRAPSKSGNPVFGLNEEYYLKYSSPHWNLAVGDNNYRLTDLTESSRYGRGAGLEFMLKSLTLGGFYNLPKFYPNVKSIYSVYGSISPFKKLKINVGLLNKTFATDSIPDKSFVTDSVATLMTASVSMSLLKSISLDVEYAMGKTTGKSTAAYKASLRINKSKYRSYVNYTWADPDFPGYFSDSRYFSTGISTSIIPKSSFSLNYEFNHANLALDTLYSNAPLTSNMSFSGMFRIRKKHNLGFAVYMRSREDRMENKLFNYKEMTGRIILQSKFKRFELSLYGEFGKIDNLLEPTEGELTNIYKSYLSLLFRFNKNVSLDAFANYQGGKYYQQGGEKALFYGATFNAHIRKKLDVLVEYQSNFALEEYNKDRSLLSSRIKFALNRNHEIGFSANYNLVKNTLDQKDLSIVVNYNYTINVPISRKKNIGSLKGRVLNNGVMSVEGIIFILAGNKTLTDKNGYFEFPVVRVGTYLMIIDYSHSGIGTIAERAGPYKIDITPGQTTDFEISLTKSARITGEIVIQEDANKNNRNYVENKEKLGNLIIEVSKGDEIYRIYTDKNGAFSFNDLRTGKWQLKIYETGIPEGYQLLRNLYQLELSSGQVKNVEVYIKKKTRKIKFQSSF